MITPEEQVEIQNKLRLLPQKELDEFIQELIDEGSFIVYPVSKTNQSYDPGTPSLQEREIMWSLTLITTWADMLRFYSGSYKISCIQKITEEVDKIYANLGSLQLTEELKLEE